MSGSRALTLDLGTDVAGRFKLLEILGDGAAGTVYRAADAKSKETVALKVIHPHLARDRQVLGRFRREAKILGRLSGDHLCPLIDFVEADGLAMMALPFVDGRSLERELEIQRGMPPALALRIGLQICRALEVAHAEGVIHRDLKPSNILLTGVGKDTHVHVVDFGLSKLILGESEGTMLTDLDIVFGTPDYMAPEQVAGDPLDERCDIYSLGVLLYQMLVGEIPFLNPSPLVVMRSHLKKPIPSFAEKRPELSIPSEVEAMVFGALEKNREKRYPSAAAMGAAVKKALEALSDARVEARDTLTDAPPVSAEPSDEPKPASHEPTSEAVATLSSPRTALAPIAKVDALQSDGPPPRDTVPESDPEPPGDMSAPAERGDETDSGSTTLASLRHETAAAGAEANDESQDDAGISVRLARASEPPRIQSQRGVPSARPERASVPWERAWLVVFVVAGLLAIAAGVMLGWR